MIMYIKLAWKWTLIGVKVKDSRTPSKKKWSNKPAHCQANYSEIEWT